MEIEVSTFRNFSTDTGSTDCKHKRGVDRQSRTGLIFIVIDIDHLTGSNQRNEGRLSELFCAIYSSIPVPQLYPIIRVGRFKSWQF